MIKLNLFGLIHTLFLKWNGEEIIVMEQDEEKKQSHFLSVLFVHTDEKGEAFLDVDDSASRKIAAILEQSGWIQRDDSLHPYSVYPCYILSKAFLTGIRS